MLLCRHKRPTQFECGLMQAATPWAGLEEVTAREQPRPRLAPGEAGGRRAAARSAPAPIRPTRAPSLQTKGTVRSPAVWKCLLGAQKAKSRPWGVPMPRAQVQGLPAAGAGLLQLRRAKRRRQLAPLQAQRCDHMPTTMCLQAAHSRTRPAAAQPAAAAAGHGVSGLPRCACCGEPEGLPSCVRATLSACSEQQ